VARSRWRYNVLEAAEEEALKECHFKVVEVKVFIGGDKIKEVLHIEKHEAICDLCGNSIALTKKELKEKAKDYAVIVDGRIVQVICGECRKRFWGWARRA